MNILQQKLISFQITKTFNILLFLTVYLFIPNACSKKLDSKSQKLVGTWKNKDSMDAWKFSKDGSCIYIKNDKKIFWKITNDSIPLTIIMKEQKHTPIQEGIAWELTFEGEDTIRFGWKGNINTFTRKVR